MDNTLSLARRKTSLGTSCIISQLLSSVNESESCPTVYKGKSKRYSYMIYEGSHVVVAL